MCIKVDAFRNQARGNPLGMLFGNLVGVSNQGVRATATAQVIGADTVDCLKPWAVIDRWDEFSPIQYAPTTDWNPINDPEFNYATSTFDRYSTGKGSAPPQENDTYVPPSATEVGTGYNLKYDSGTRFAVKTDTNTNSTVSPGWFRAIQIPRLDGQTGGNVYRNNISSCGGLPNSYADPSTVCPTSIGNGNAAYWAERGCYATEPGNMVGPTRQGIDDVIALDPNAMWSGGANGGVVNSNQGASWWKSKRVVPIGVIDINHFMSQDPSGANGVLKMVNIFGFFIEGMGDVNPDGTMTLNSGGKAVIGRILTIPGTGSTTVTTNATFMRSIILVR